MTGHGRHGSHLSKAHRDVAFISVRVNTEKRGFIPSPFKNTLLLFMSQNLSPDLSMVRFHMNLCTYWAYKHSSAKCRFYQNKCLLRFVYSIYSTHSFDYTNAKHLVLKNKAACSLLQRGLLNQGAEPLIH